MSAYRDNAHSWGGGTFEAFREETLYRCELTRIFRLRRDGESIVCKELLGPNALQRFRHEKGILERLSGIPGVPRLAAGAHPPGVIAMEDSEALLLEDLLARGVSPEELLKLSADLAETLAAVHEAGVAHKNLAPDNVLVCRDTMRPLLIDYSLATTFAEERPPFLHHNEIAGNFPYLSPEQTGRTGRSVDQRSDLYGLGAVLYRAACGRDPFEGADPLQLVRDILTKTPTPPLEVNSSLSPTFSSLIMRLLEKEPDRRYQSAAGVAHDLRRLVRDMAHGGSGVFTLGERDFPLRLIPPSTLTGRDREVAVLAAALERGVQGSGQGVIVCGPPGVGKTALVRELIPLVSARRGWFVSGKFEQYRHDGAASATVQALRALGRLLLAEPEGELAQHRERILAELGSGAGLIAGSLPEFASLLGIPPEPISGDPVEGQTRLYRAGLALLRALASPERPLVMFIDDLQWGGRNSIAFLDAVLCAEGLSGFLLVGAYRDAEVAATHPLAAVLPRWQALAGVTLLPPLKNLPAADLGRLLEEMLHLHAPEAAMLARGVAEHTGGNPYDTLEFLNALRADRILLLGPEGWTWQESAVRRYLAEGDVLTLLSQRLGHLPERCRLLLRTIACLGGMVDEGILHALETPADDLEAGVVPALEDGILVYHQRELRFRHDRAQQCVYDGMAKGVRDALHLSLARRLSSVPHLAVLAAEQYLPSLHLVVDGGELGRAAQLFLEGARQAKSTANYSDMERLLSAAVDCCHREESLWREPELLGLKTEWHIALYSLGRFEEGDRVYDAIEKESIDPLALVEAVCIQINSLTNRGRQGDAVLLALNFLSRLGFPGPKDLELEVAQGVERLYLFEKEGKVEKREELRDPVLLAAATVLRHSIAPAFFTEPYLCFWLQLTSQRLWMEHGPCAALLAGFAGAPLVTAALHNDYATGCRVAEAALFAGESLGYEPVASWVRHCYALFGSHWVAPLELSVRESRLAREGLLRYGELQFACFSYHTSVAALLDCSPTIGSFKEELDCAIAFALRTGNEFSAPVFEEYHRLWTILTGESTPGTFEEPFREERYLERLAAHPLATVKYHIHRALCAAIFADDDALVQHASLAQPLLPYIQGFYQVALAHVLQALSLARGLAAAPPEERAPLVAALAAERSWLAERSAESPENFKHLLHLVEAEERWGAGTPEEAMAAFDAALLAAEQRQRPWHRALITERCALFHAHLGLTRAFRKLMVEARYLYGAWGAAAKVRQLEERYPFLLDAVKERRMSDGRLGVTVSSNSLDLLAILRASQALSKETSMERLKSRVVELLKSSTGATAVLLALRSHGGEGWMICGGGDTPPLSSLAAEAAGMMPLAPLRYVERTKEPLLVEDATHDQRFCRDPYFAGVEQCSLMVVPILNHGTPSALLILENRLSCAAFTPQRLDTVQLMAGQLAVSLENAGLYTELEERVAERTRELEKAQNALVATARAAGMAEIATNVLHNVGNVLNSVNISAGVVESALRDSKVAGLSRAVGLLKEHGADLGGYLSEHPTGRLIPEYLQKLSVALAEEHHGVLGEISRLTKSVDHIKEIVATQQSYAGCVSVVEEVRVAELLEDALRMNGEALTRHRVTVERLYAEVPPVTLDKARLLQILVNLISNAKYALDAVVEGKRRLTLATEAVAGKRLRIRVIDEGEGISSENLSRIFTHGFTTRKGGHGFGLHSCALAAKEMGGTLTAASDGPGQGAVFTLELPLTRQ